MMRSQKKALPIPRSMTTPLALHAQDPAPVHHVPSPDHDPDPDPSRLRGHPGLPPDRGQDRPGLALLVLAPGAEVAAKVEALAVGVVVEAGATLLPDRDQIRPSVHDMTYSICKSVAWLLNKENFLSGPCWQVVHQRPKFSQNSSHYASLHVQDGLLIEQD